jgi:hypothetical protein
MARTICRVLLCLVLLAAVALTAQAPSRPGTAEITLGQAAAPLFGPWKFTVGDSPLDPATGQPLWEESGFDDSHWETVDLTPKSGSFDQISGTSSYVPGWTARGHAGYWGHAWYRIRVRVYPHSADRLALAGPADVDDAYQVFANGTLLGSLGKFSGGGQGPVVYYTQPKMFELPAGNAADRGERALAFRVWVQPSTLRIAPDAGGMHTAPTLGEHGAVAARYQLAWLEQARAFGSFAILAALYLLLSVMAISLVLFDPHDAAYRWLAAVFFVIAIADAELCVADWTQLVSDERGRLFGFDRVLELARTGRSATQITEAAQAFGQEDDISVIAVTRVPVAEPADGATGCAVCSATIPKPDAVSASGDVRP